MATTKSGDVAWRWIGIDERERKLEVVAVEAQGAHDAATVPLVIHVMRTTGEGTLVIKHNAPRITTETAIGPDVDLDHEDVRLPSGKQLTTKVAAEIVDDDVRRVGGRPSLSGKAARSPQIAFRVPPEVRERAAEVAAAEGKTVSQLAREALKARLAG
jgi:hypothetical protein